MTAGKTYTLGELAERFSLELYAGNSGVCVESLEITGFATLQNACDSQLSFFSNKAYRPQLRVTNAAAVILRESEVLDCPVPALVSDNPYLAYARISALFDERWTFCSPGVHSSAVIHPAAVVSPSACIGPNAVVEEGVHIGAHAVVGAGCSIARNSRIGERTYLYPRVAIYHDVIVGNDVILHSGVVLGADGFGFAKNDEQWCKIHQLGGVIIGDRVEIGANSCIDRGALDDTVIGDGVIVDNLVQIAHNVKIGANTAIAACTGIAGSTVIGSGCTIAGAVGIVGHLTIADGVHITAKSLVTGSINQPGSYSSGTAIQETSKWRKNAVRFLQLDNLFYRVRMLEARFNVGK